MSAAGGLATSGGFRGVWVFAKPPMLNIYTIRLLLISGGLGG